MGGLVETLNGVAGSWADTMGAVLWQSTALAGVVTLICLIFKRISPAIRYWLWMFIGLRLLVMPFVTLEFAIFPASMSVQEISASVAPPPTGAASSSIDAEGDDPHGTLGRDEKSIAGPRAMVPLHSAPVEAAISLSWKAVLMLLWCGGFALALVRLALACRRTRRLIAASRFCDCRIDMLAVRASTYFGMSSQPRVRISSESVSPFVCGAWKSVVILPEDFSEKASDEQLMVVLAHEFAHARRRDPLLGWVFALAQALYFFHPALPLVKRQLLLERERACDDWVLAVSNARPSTYARVLISVAALCSAPRQAVPALVTGESFQDLKRRLHSLRGESGARARINPVSGVLLSLVGLLVVPGFALTQQPASEPHAVPVALPDLHGTSINAPVARIGKTDVKPTLAPVRSETSVGETTAPKTRILRFPPNRVVGMLQVKDCGKEHYIDRYWYWNDDVEWTPAGPAVGTVTIPEGNWVYLILNEEGVRDTSFLNDLGPDDIYRLAGPFGEVKNASLDDRGMENIVALQGLRHLELRYSQVTDRGLALLQRLPNLERLEVPPATTDIGLGHISQIVTLQGLYLKDNRVSNAGLAHLTNLQGLREIELGGGSISDAGLEHLASLPKLSYVLLWGNKFNDAAMEYIARIPNLTSLNVSKLRLTNRGVQCIARAPKLETLSLYGIKEITGAALKYIAEMKTLRTLDLSSPLGEESRLNSNSMSFLANSPSLEVLDAPRSIDDIGLVHLAGIQTLRELNTGGWAGSPSITDKGVLAISSIASLRKLSIVGGGLTDSGLTAIGRLRNLESLSILTSSRQITDVGVAELTNLKKLKDLSLNLNCKSGVTLAALTALSSLSSLKDLTVYGVNQDDSVLDLSPMLALEKVSLDIEGGLRDHDVACFSSMSKLVWLQGLSGISDRGVGHIEGLTQLVRLGIQGEGLSDVALSRLKGLRALDTLTVSGDFTDEGLQELNSLQGLHWLTVESITPLSGASQERLVASLPNLSLYNRESILAGVGG